MVLENNTSDGLFELNRDGILVLSVQAFRLDFIRQQKRVNKVKDLYTTNPKEEQGWYAVRELFNKIPAAQIDEL